MAAVDEIDFDGAEFRDGIWLAMEVGLPVDPAEQPTFVFPAGIVDTGDERDADGVPFDWRAPRDRVAPDATFQVPCAVEYIDDTGKVTGLGVVSPSRVILTLLDEDYQLIKGFSYVVIGGNKYVYQRTQPPMAMVSVGVYQIHCRADDEG